jgi:hypothetical protein
LNWDLEYDPIAPIIPLWKKLIENKRWDMLSYMIQLFNEAKIRGSKHIIELDIVEAKDEI